MSEYDDDGNADDNNDSEMELRKREKKL